jgi:NAD(P)-dependent dehydrogenase (short-subunit alcohol dehydrogenase family)
VQTREPVLQGKVALVTGSTTGIGEAIARKLHGAGARVVIHGQSEQDAQAVFQSLEAERPGEAFVHIAELEDPEECERLVEATAAHFGGIDILVNNAAVMTRSNLETTDAALFDRILATNLRAPLLLTRAALPHFRKNGGGRVLNIGSINGYCGEANLLAYSLSKGGLITFSRNLADAHGREGLIVIHFNVGWTLTPNEYALKMREGLPADWPTRLPRTTAPSGALLSPQQIAHFALAFLSEDAGPVNGAVIDLEQYPVIGRNPLKETV